MKKLTIVLSSLALAAIGAFSFASCTNPAATTTNLPTNVAVSSATTTSITVTWTRDPSDNGADTVYVMNGTANAGASPAISLSPSTTSTITGLTIGVAYTISVHSTDGASTSITYTIAGPPTAMMVNSASATSIGAEWTRGAGDNGADTIVAMNSSGAVVATSNTTASTGLVTGLAEGVTYTISVHGTSGTTNSMDWMTAQRSGPFQIFEKSDPSASDPSALVLASNATHGISLSGAANADFVLDDVSGVSSGISLEAGDVYNVGWNATLVNPRGDYIPGGLTNDYRSTDYSTDLIGATANAYDIPSDAVYNTKGSRVLIVRTADGHMALVEIVPDASGTLYSTNSAGYKYITIKVSYQSTVAAPYAARAHPRNAGPVLRNSAN